MVEEPLLAMHDLHVRIGAADVLVGASLRVDPGACVGLVGETGSGKTMTVRAACGLLERIGARRTHGTIHVAGLDLSEAGERGWRDLRGGTISLVPQASMSALDPLMTIGRQLRETVRIHDRQTDSATVVRRLLSDVRLDPDERLLRAYPHELSGGMRQRVMLALALAGDPALIIADEPTTALDVTIKRAIADLLQSLQHERGLGLLVVSHDLGLIESLAETVVVMYGGRTVESGPTQEVLAGTSHPYTQALLGALPQRSRPGTRLHAIAGAPPTPSDALPGCAFAGRCPAAEPACEERRPSLTQVAPGHSIACIRHEPRASRAA